MTDNEAFDRAVKSLAEAACEAARAIIAGVVTAVDELRPAIDEFLVAYNSLDFNPLELVSSLSLSTLYERQYNLARLENPKWVWYAEHHKKKRIRNKYHNKIMKEYGRL